MIQQTAKEVAEAMQQDPQAWADQYIHLTELLCDLEQTYEKLVLQVSPGIKAD